MNRQCSNIFGNFIEKWLVAGILIIVATIQFTLAYSAGLSPWKGGGFGMFGAVDSPSMRTIYAEGIDSSGNSYRINAWSILSASERRSLQSFPRPVILQSLAESLLSSEFVRSYSEVLSAYKRLKLENPLVDLQITQTTLIEAPIYRVRKPEDPQLSKDQIKSFQKIRLQMWRLRLDSHEMKVWSEPFVGSIVVEK